MSGALSTTLNSGGASPYTPCAAIRLQSNEALNAPALLNTNTVSNNIIDESGDIGISLYNPGNRTMIVNNVIKRCTNACIKIEQANNTNYYGDIQVLGNKFYLPAQSNYRCVEDWGSYIAPLVPIYANNTFIGTDTTKGTALWLASTHYQVQNNQFYNVAKGVYFFTPVTGRYQGFNCDNNYFKNVTVAITQKGSDAYGLIVNQGNTYINVSSRYDADGYYHCGYDGSRNGEVATVYYAGPCGEVPPPTCNLGTWKKGDILIFKTDEPTNKSFYYCIQGGQGYAAVFENPY
jgi:hypothetical protein